MKYDLVIPEIEGVRGFHLPLRSVVREVPPAVAVAQGIESGVVGKSSDLGARTLLPKDQMDRMAPFLENVLTLGFRITRNLIFADLGSSSRMRIGPDGPRSKEGYRDRTKRKRELNQSTIVEP